MYKQDWTLNNLQWMICHETQPDQTNLEYVLINNEKGTCKQEDFAMPTGYSVKMKKSKR